MRFKTLIVIEVTHDREIPDLADKVAARAYTLQGVRDATGWVQRNDGLPSVMELERAGFSLDEIALGMTEVVR